MPRGSDPIETLTQTLEALALPVVVLYALQAQAAGMVAAAADGILPFGDIILVATSITLAAVLAVNWNATTPHIDDIIDAFSLAFTQSAANVVSAFEAIYVRQTQAP